MRNKPAITGHGLDRSITHCIRVACTALAAGLPLLAVSACSPQPAAADVKPRPTVCLPAQLDFSLDAGNGRFNGMSHSGTALVLRNTGAGACTIPARPDPAFVDEDRHALDLAVRGPLSADAAPPVTLAPGAGVTSDMRWVSSNVYPDGHCESPAFIRLAIGTHSLVTPFAGRLCGAGGQPSRYTLAPWRTTGVPSPAVAKARSYTCEDGRTVRAAYPDTATALLTIDGQTRRLRVARSADGARYTDGHWQWWTKGAERAWLAPLSDGESIASAKGVACEAR